jgi:raffinose/stachyose/melibiose transport system substrate-binding protein
MLREDLQVKRKLISSILVMSMLATLIVGCGSASSGDDSASAGASTEAGSSGSSDDKIVLNVINYHVGTDYAADYYSYLFSEFQKTEEGKNVEFNFEEIPTTDAFNQKIKLLISSGDLPDIVLNGGNNITALAAEAGKVADLTPYFDADPEWKATFDEESLEFNTVDGKIYGVPVSKEISYIYYNKTLFEEAGIEAPDVAYETWDEFFEVCDTLLEKGITPLGMDTADLGWLSNLWYSALIGTDGEAGNEFMNTMYPTDYNTPEVEAATETLQEMLAKYTTSDAIGGKYDTMATHFFNGEVAMFPNGPWMIPDIGSDEKAPEGFYDEVGIMLLPEYGMEMVPTPGDMVGATDPDKIEAAVAFLKFETSIENQLKGLEMAGLQPVATEIDIPDSLTDSDPLMAEVLDIQSKAKWTYGQNQAYWYQNVIDEFSNELPELAYGNMTATEFCTKLTEAAQKN